MVSSMCACEAMKCNRLLDGMAATYDEVSEMIDGLGHNKGVGPDELPGELLQAGGVHTRQFMHDVANDMLAVGWFATRWRGGRLAKLWKRKSSTLVCDNFRGLLLADHASKVMTGLLQHRLRCAYEKEVAPEQFGCAKNRGTSHAAAYTAFFNDACRLAERSMSILFVDLTKAFDMALREVLLGWMPPMSEAPDEQKTAYLSGLGLSDLEAADMCEFINRTGGILAEAGVDSSCCRFTTARGSA